MPNAVTVGDSSNHPGIISGPGISSVLIGGYRAAVKGDMHICFRQTRRSRHPATSISNGSSSVLIGGQPAARMGDSVECGAVIVSGESSVLIGG